MNKTTRDRLCDSDITYPVIGPIDAPLSRLMYALIGRRNAAPFRGWPAGTLLLVNATLERFIFCHRSDRHGATWPWIGNYDLGDFDALDAVLAQEPILPDANEP